MALRLIGSLAVLWLAACGSDPKSPAVDAGACTTPGQTAFTKVCSVNEDCQSCLCADFGHAKACSKSCTGDADCPAPSGGCTQNVCRP